MKMVFIFRIPITLFSLLLFNACTPKTIALTRSRLLMGHVPVNITIRAHPDLKEKALEASEEAYQLAQEIEGRISEYQPTSEVSCLNQNAGKASCSISADTMNLLKQSADLSEKTDHAFDIRFASLTSHGRKAPFVFEENSKARLTHANTRIGVGAIGKGFIIDAMLDLIRSKGFQEALIDGGGDLRAIGGPWKVAIQQPEEAPGTLAKVLEISDKALATSGNYEQEGHILDPRTGKKVLRTASVTVIANNLTLADALATAFYVLGEPASIAYLKKFPGIQMIWTEKNGKTSTYSEGAKDDSSSTNTGRR
jgi:thiamine biosynthesis lipoprotein